MYGFPSAFLISTLASITRAKLRAHSEYRDAKRVGCGIDSRATHSGNRQGGLCNEISFADLEKKNDSMRRARSRIATAVAADMSL